MGGGPWQSQRWFGTLREGARQYADTIGKACPISKDELEHLLEDQELQGHVGVPIDVEMTEEELLASATDNLEGTTDHKFQRVGMCRWFQIVRISRRLICEWTQRLVLMSYLFVGMSGHTVAHAEKLAKAMILEKPKSYWHDQPI